MLKVLDIEEAKLDDQPTAPSNFDTTKNEIRAGFEDFIRVNFDETGFMSAAEAASQRRYVNSILNNPNASEAQLKDLSMSYLGSFAEHSKLENQRTYFNEVVAPLKNALDSGAISAASYREWINWIRDPNRVAKDKKTSIASVLPEYLAKRRKLAGKRQALLGDKRMQALLDSSDPTLKATATKVADQDYFLNALSFDQREKLLIECTAALPLGASEVALFTSFSKELEQAEKDGLISAGSMKKWVARFKDPSVNLKAKTYFVGSQFPSYVAAWKAVKVDRANLLKDPVITKLTAEHVKHIKVFTDDKAFLELHHDKKLSLLSEVRAGITAFKAGKETLHTETKSVLTTAATAGYISSNKIGPWLEHVIGGKRTLAELKNFVKDWAKVRHRFDKIELRISESKVPQGLQRISLETFLNLSYDQRQSYVNEAERRLHIDSNEAGNTVIRDFKGKIRHALDSENWEEAKHYLVMAWPHAKNDDDIHELQSMENYLKNFGGKKEVSPDQEKLPAIKSALQKIDSAYEQLPPEVKPFYDKAFLHDSNCAWCLGVMMYNVQWGLERGYQPQDLTKVREQAARETPERMRPGHGHSDGLENNLIDGHGRPAIREEGWGPQNICTSSSEAERIVDSANANKSNFSYWYWNNLIIKGVSSGQYANISYVLRRQIVSGMRTLESFGENYHSAKNYVSLQKFSGAA